MPPAAIAPFAPPLVDVDASAVTTAVEGHPAKFCGWPKAACQSQSVSVIQLMNKTYH